MKEKRKILIIDDDPGIGEMLQILLELNGFSVLVSAKPTEAEDLVTKNQVDVILLDKLIAGVNGTEVCARLKSNELTRGLPILMMSALHQAEEDCKRAGATDFIAKPFDIDDLLMKIENLM